MGSSQDVSGNHGWSSQVKSGQIRSGQILKPGQLKSVAAEKQFAIWLELSETSHYWTAAKDAWGIGILLGLRQRVDTTTDGKRRRGHFGACAF